MNGFCKSSIFYDLNAIGDFKRIRYRCYFMSDQSKILRKYVFTQ